jgi:hypothetical protein
VTKLWTRLPAKVREQIVRAGRLFAVTLAGSLATLQGKHVDASVALSLVVAAIEVVFRQLVPVTPDKPPVTLPPAADKQAGAVNLVTILVVLAIIAVLIFLWLHLSIHPH